MKTRLFPTALILMLLSSLLLIRNSLPAQNLTFVPMDENYGLTLKFHKVDTVLVVFPTGFQPDREDSALIESYVFWDQYQKKPAYVYLSENRLSSADYAKNIQFYGPYASFQNLSLLTDAIRQTPDGFAFGGRVFEQTEDAFFYIENSAKRFYTCRNSKSAAFPFTLLPAGSFQLNIWRGNTYMIQANFDQNTKTWQVNELEKMRDNYFCPTVTAGKLELSVSKSLGCGNTIEEISQRTASFIDSLCHLIGREPSALPAMRCYFYATHEDLQQFLGLPSTQTVYGKSMGNTNHISGLNTDVLFHEVGHAVIDHGLGKYPNSFWQEGFRQFTTYYFSEKAFRNDLQEARLQNSLLNRQLIDNKHHEYFTNWSNYPLSGIFMAFLTNAGSYDQILQAYRNQALDQLLVNIFDSPESAIAAFKLWMDEEPENPLHPGIKTKP